MSGTVLDVAREVAAEIAAASPTSIRLSLDAIAETAAIADEVEAVRVEPHAMAELLVSQDTMEGVMAFLEKREPRWRNR